MHQCVKTINEYYTNLEYKGNRKVSINNIYIFIKVMRFNINILRTKSENLIYFLYNAYYYLLYIFLGSTRKNIQFM